LSQSGFDVGVRYALGDLGENIQDFQVSYQGNIVDAQDRQNNATVESLDCKGTFGTSCTGDFASIVQADYRHRTWIDFSVDAVNVQIGWRMIGSVDAALNDSVSIGSQNYIDLAATYKFADTYEVTFGIDNLFDKQPPIPESGGNFFGTVSDYDVIGRTVGVTFRFRP
jgi:iron complex outermembrane receptor protein